MLSMLEITEQKECGRLRRWWNGLTVPAVRAILRPAGNTHYLKISCEKRGENIDWRMIRAYSLDSSERILMPSGVEPPEKLGIRRYVPYAFRRRMLENLAMEILVCSERRPELRRVAVYGQESEVVTLLPSLTALAGEVRVITRRPHAVTDTVEALRARTGASIGVTAELDASGFDILLAPAGGAGVFRLEGSEVVLSPDRPAVPAALWIRSAIPCLPPVLEDIYSTEYDLTEFVGAFYETGEMRELARISPAAGITESGEISPEEAALIIGR